jgi:hypothetical protein
VKSFEEMARRQSQEVASHSVYVPAQRYGHTLVQVGDKMYLWAGGMKQMPPYHASAEKEALISKIDILSLKSGRWERQHTRGSAHSGVCHYAATPVNSEIYYFGGQCGHGRCYHNSLSKFITTELKWREFPADLFGAPMAKYGCGMVSFEWEGETYLFVFGGNVYGALDERQKAASYTEAAADMQLARCNEQHIISTSGRAWTSPAVIGECPPPCISFTLKSIGKNKAIMFGGYLTGIGRSNSIYIAELTKDTVTWTKLAQSPDVDGPAPRSDNAACVLTGIPNGSRQPYPILVIAGGFNSEGKIFSDFWLLNCENGEWRQVIATPLEVGRALSSMSLMNIGAQYAWIVMFGGAKSWNYDHKVSTKDQPLCSDTAVIELCWNLNHQRWDFISTMDSAQVYSKYQRNLKERLDERRKSLQITT